MLFSEEMENSGTEEDAGRKMNKSGHCLVSCSEPINRSVAQREHV